MCHDFACFEQFRRETDLVVEVGNSSQVIALADEAKQFWRAMKGC